MHCIALTASYPIYQVLHSLCTVYALYMHCICTHCELPDLPGIALAMHCICTVLHSLRATQSTRYCTRYALYMHCIALTASYSIYQVLHSLCTVYALYAHCICTHCELPDLPGAYCTLYCTHVTLYYTRFSLYCTHYALYCTHCTLYCTHSTQSTRCLLYTVLYSLFTVLYPPYTVLFPIYQRTVIKLRQGKMPLRYPEETMGIRTSSACDFIGVQVSGLLVQQVSFVHTHTD
jgi:hypothetical protein